MCVVCCCKVHAMPARRAVLAGQASPRKPAKTNNTTNAPAGSLSRRHPCDLQRHDGCGVDAATSAARRRPGRRWQATGTEAQLLPGPSCVGACRRSCAASLAAAVAWLPCRCYCRSFLVVSDQCLLVEFDDWDFRSLCNSCQFFLRCSVYY